MSIRFKFRSSVKFDSVDIDGRSSISVRELRLKIIRYKNLNICQDFDLIFSDAASSQEYDDDNFQIPSGSSVIIKRIPAGAATSAMQSVDAVGNFGVKGFYPPNPASDQMDEFDEFGADLSPLPPAIQPSSDLKFVKKICGSGEKANVASLRLECPKLEPGDQAIPRGYHDGGNRGNILEEQRVEEHMKLEKLFSHNAAAVQNMGLPSELKCFLCNTYFKDAVMIPCCQHSFCEKCIRRVLVEKARCPKCFSDICKPEDLLPNLSLRQAIEHFIESQMPTAGSENVFNKYAPDGESGIQGKDASCTVTVVQREPVLPHSPSATGKGSNQVMADSFYDSIMRRNTSFGPSDYHINNIAARRESSAPTTQKVKGIFGRSGVYAHCANGQSGPEDLDHAADFQGENLPFNSRQTHVYDKADSTHDRKRGVWVESGGGDKSFQATGRHIKGSRTCYMCGSPEHLIRDCPVSSGGYPVLQTRPYMLQGGIPGYASSYWNGAAYPYLRPFPNLYSNHAMRPFSGFLVPITPYGVPPYVSSMYGGLPTPLGIEKTGIMVPQLGKRAEYPVGYSDYLEVQHAENKRKLSNENLGRGQNFDTEDDFHYRYRYGEPERSHECEVRKEREASGSHSEDSFARRSRKKNQLARYGDPDTCSVDGRHEKSSRSSLAGRDQKSYPSERSGPGIEHTSSDKHREDRYKHHNRSSRKQHERKEQSHSVCNCGHRRQSGKADDVRRRVDSGGSHEKQDTYLESGLSSPCDQRREYKDRDSGMKSRYPRHHSKRKNEDLRDDRWQMVSGSDGYRDDYRHHKRERVKQVMGMT